MRRSSSSLVLLVLLGALVGCSTAAPAPATPSADAAACRQVQHVSGTACVPAEPRRIVALDSITVLPTLVDLGEPVVGALSVYGAGQPFPSYLPAASTAGIELVGTMQTPDLERIAALQPDLIIGSVPIAEPIRADLERIAPTVVVPYSVYEATWQDDIRLIGRAVDREADVERSLTELAGVAESTKAAIGAHTLSRVDVFQGTPLYYAFGCTWIGGVLTAAGVTQPAGQKSECASGDYSSALTYLTLEDLRVLDAQAIVAYQQQATEGEVGASPLAELERSPLWGGLTAVRDGRVFVLGDAWGLGGSVAAAEQVYADLRETVFTR